MYKKQILVKNPSGLHARPGSDFVNLAKQFESTIKIHRIDKPEKVANAKSIVFVLSLGIKKDMTVEIEATGNDEEKAVNALIDLIDSGFGE
jgi:phosphocarrier protein HPr